MRILTELEHTTLSAASAPSVLGLPSTAHTAAVAVAAVAEGPAGVEDWTEVWLTPRA